MYNTLDALFGGANLVGGLLRKSRLDDAQADVNKARERFAEAAKAHKALTKQLKLSYGMPGPLDSADFFKVTDIEAEMDIASVELTDAQARLDKIQSQGEYWRAATGAGQMLTGLGVTGNSVLPSYAPAPAAVPAGYQPAMISPAGEVLLPLAVGGAAGALTGYLASRPAGSSTGNLAGSVAKVAG